MRYEYEKANAYQEQIASSLSIERSKKSYQAFNGEIGSRVIICSYKTKDKHSIININNANCSFCGREKNRQQGQEPSIYFNVLRYETQQTIGSGTISTNTQNEKTTLNAGIGLIASARI